MKTLKYWKDSSKTFKDHYEYVAEGLIIFVEYDHNYYVFELDEDDGYRSHCDEWEQIPNITIINWIKDKGLQEHKVPYDTLERSKTSGETVWNIQAWNKSTIIFALGTDDEDDYYPGFNCVGIGELDNDEEDNPSKR